MSSVYTCSGHCRLSKGCARETEAHRPLLGPRRQLSRREGPVSSSTGKTSNGAVIIARIKIPKKPIPLWLPLRALGSLLPVHGCCASAGRKTLGLAGVQPRELRASCCRPWSCFRRAGLSRLHSRIPHLLLCLHELLIVRWIEIKQTSTALKVLDESLTDRVGGSC